MTVGMSTTTVLGIDPGSRVTGLGIVASKGSQLQHCYSESIRTGDGSLGERLAVIYSAVSDAITRYRPDSIAIEQVFVSKNPRSALVLGHARGSAVLAAVHHQLPMAEYSALQIKRAVVGTGSASKTQVQHMVRVLLNLQHKPPFDASDGLACAICHIHTASGLDRMAGVRQVIGS